MIAIIVAYTKDRVIGKDGIIPWKIKGEQLRFKELTTGQIVVFGRVSYEEIGRPLPNRQTVVISRTTKYEEKNCITVESLEQAIAYANGRDLFISGGARLYEEALPLADVLYITEIDAHIDGDRYFPMFREEEYDKEVVERVEGEIPYTYLTYRRKGTTVC